ncbi:hypothetical protein BJ508DRAFT_378731 [Ascobolus immersus RN42]|uniref:Uncharacterized protein n=1 Tax=Ascobolus immersus RN42 TaxID=1160509 RepID=A0A3N4HVJ5_ASCIM|nr:hypothetical protein BJ508DRAFT_378731 [Ascobolus immersus RN42]
MTRLLFPDRRISDNFGTLHYTTLRAKYTGGLMDLSRTDKYATEFGVPYIAHEQVIRTAMELALELRQSNKRQVARMGYSRSSIPGGEERRVWRIVEKVSPERQREGVGAGVAGEGHHRNGLSCTVQALEGSEMLVRKCRGYNTAFTSTLMLEVDDIHHALSIIVIPVGLQGVGTTICPLLVFVDT